MAAKVGLTGGIGSGKTVVAGLFADQKILVVDADTIAREITRPGTPALSAITSHFGHCILHPDGHLDRSALRRIVFARDDQRQWLESLLHPIIRQEMDQRAQACPDPYCILDIPLLIETKRQGDMDCVIVVHCPRQRRIDRLMRSRNMSRQEIERIMKQQVTDRERVAAADWVLKNDSDLTTLKTRFQSLFTTLTSRFGR